MPPKTTTHRIIGPGFVDPHGLAGHFILPQGYPGPADTGILQTSDNKNRNQNE